MMEQWDIIAVGIKANNEGFDLEDKLTQVEAYMYGRYFLMGWKTTEYVRTYRAFYLVEARYTHSIIPRMSSGLIWARVAESPEYGELGMP